jgi:hypothetical protein
MKDSGCVLHGAVGVPYGRVQPDSAREGRREWCPARPRGCDQSSGGIIHV